VAPLLAGIIFIGVYPQPLLSRIQPAVNHLIAHVEYADPSLKLPSGTVGRGTFAVPPDQVVDMPTPKASGTASASGGS
jgi:NADH-quinone oxidoreductase subunit M